MTPQRLFSFFSAALIAATMLCGVATAVAQNADPLSKDSILRDQDIPALGNPDGDITIVEYFDYRCPYCKSASLVLDEVLKADPKVRLVLKDWPILGDPSPYAARIVLASKYQNKYEVAHRALIGVKGRLSQSAIDETLGKAGVDVARAKADLDANKASIDALLKRNEAQAEALGFRGTPAFIVGSFRVPNSLTAEQFRLAIADAREAARKKGGTAK